MVLNEFTRYGMRGDFTLGHIPVLMLKPVFCLTLDGILKKELMKCNDFGLNNNEFALKIKRTVM